MSPHCSDAEKLKVPLLIRTSVIDKFVKGIFPMNRQIGPIQYELVSTISTISEYTHHSNVLDSIQAILDI